MEDGNIIDEEMKVGEDMGSLLEQQIQSLFDQITLSERTITKHYNMSVELNDQTTAENKKIDVCYAEIDKLQVSQIRSGAFFGSKSPPAVQMEYWGGETGGQCPPDIKITDPSNI